MKALIVSNRFPTSGPESQYCFETIQAKALAASGVDVAYAALCLTSLKKLPKYAISHAPYVCPNLEAYIINGPIVWRYTWLGKYLVSRALWKLYKHIFSEWGRPDVIHAHFSIYQGLAATSLAQKIHCPLIITEHSSNVMVHDANYWTNRASCSAWKAADRVIAVSKPLAERIHTFSGVNATVIHNMLDIVPFLGVKRNSESGFGFITVGSLIPRKNHAQLLEAFAAVHSEHKDTRLGIIGEGELEQFLKDKAASLGISEAVKFYGLVAHTRMAEIYNSYDCFVFPSLHETFGVSPAEAMASGMPVIASACGGPEDFVRDEDGILVERGSLEALTEAMMRMYSSHGNYDGHKIRAYAEANFAPEHIARKIIGVYESVCSTYNG